MRLNKILTHPNTSCLCGLRVVGGIDYLRCLNVRRCFQSAGKNGMVSLLIETIYTYIYYIYILQ